MLGGRVAFGMGHGSAVQSARADTRIKHAHVAFLSPKPELRSLFNVAQSSRPAL